MKVLIAILFTLLLASHVSHAQSTRGLSLPAESKSISAGKTYALIVGISRYKNPAIPQLQYADRDAEAFRNYLLATGVDSNNIILRTNENARYADIMLDLNDICMEKAKAGDKVFIYFSGHGDVESKVITNDGYLLPYDAPRIVYAISAINVKILESYVATMSSKGILPIVITDACHSGSLAGGIEGLKNIQTTLGGKWQDEVKILSCQPGELSLEGKQWGGGRGLFSYELINGMAGMADKDKDGKVSLRELNLYLMDKVPDGASPALQNPMLFGDMATKISNADLPYMSMISKHAQPASFASVDIKGFDESVLAGLSDSIRADYRLFRLMMDSQVYVRANDTILLPSAAYYYRRVPVGESTRVLTAMMQRNLASGIMNKSIAFMDDFINKSGLSISMPILEQGVSEMKFLRTIMSDDKLKKTGFYAKAIAIQYFRIHSLDEIPIAKKQIDLALSFDPDAAYLYLLRGTIKTLGKDSSVSDLRKAIALSPRWEYAQFVLGNLYLRTGKFDSAIIMGNSIINSFPAEYNYDAFVLLSIAYDGKKNTDSATLYYNKLLECKLLYKDTAVIVQAYMNIGRSQEDEGMYDLAIRYFDRTAALNRSPSPNARYHLARCAALLHRRDDCLRSLEASLRAGYKDYTTLKADTAFDLVRSGSEYQTLVKKYFPDTVSNTASHLKPADLDRYPGVYSSTQLPIRLTITRQDDKLIAQATGQSPFPLQPTGINTFAFEPASIAFEFRPDEGKLIMQQRGGSYIFIKTTNK